MSSQPNRSRTNQKQPAPFDRVARIYRTMEVLSFGPMLERCRFSSIGELGQCRRALVLGDGDGRFVARLLKAHPQLRADAVDASPAMLRLLEARVRRAGAAVRLTTRCADARSFEPRRSASGCGYDLVATHFFLDCLTEDETEELIARVRPCLAPGAVWVVSEFAVPEGRRMRAWWARRVIGFLYAAFRVLTGLAVREVPPWPALLARHGFTRRRSQLWLGGLLVSEVWEAGQATAAERVGSHGAVTSIMMTTLSGPGPVPGIDPGPEPTGLPPIPTPDPAPGPPPEPDPEPYPGPIPAPQPVTRG